MTGNRERDALWRLTLKEGAECLSFAVRELRRVETLPSITLDLQELWRELLEELRESLRMRRSSICVTQLCFPPDFPVDWITIAKLYAQGLTSSQIAYQMGIATVTVKRRLRLIFRELEFL